MNPNNNKHIEELIDLYLHDKLSQDEIEEIWIRILNRPEYLEYLKVNLLLHELYKKKLGTQLPLPARYYRWATAMAAVFMVIFFINYFYPAYEAPPLTTARIELHELESPFVTRSANQHLVGADSLLHFAFNAAVMGDPYDAIRVYNDLAADQRYDSYAAQAFLNLGILQYNEQCFEDAAQAFLSALAKPAIHPRMKEKLHWYLGHTLINLNAFDSGTASINIVYEMKGTYQSGALHMLRALDSMPGK
ncbi:MAG: hypothetical protein WDZ53_09945 [Balneolales bacterium]